MERVCVAVLVVVTLWMNVQSNMIGIGIYIQRNMIGGRIDTFATVPYACIILGIHKVAERKIITTETIIFANEFALLVARITNAMVLFLLAWTRFLRFQAVGYFGCPVCLLNFSV